MQNVKVYYSGNGYLVEMNGETYAIPSDGTVVRTTQPISAFFRKLLVEWDLRHCPEPVRRCVFGVARFRHKHDAGNRDFWRETLTIPGGEAPVLDMAG